MKFVKSIIVGGTLILSSFIGFAHGHVHGPDYIHDDIVWGKSLNYAINSAEKDDFLLIEFSKPYCNGYKAFAASVLDQDDVKVFIKENFIPVELHPLKYRNLIKKYNIVNVPTFIVADNMGRELDRFTGYPEKQKFKSDLIKMKNDSNNFFNLKKRANSGKASVDDFYMLAGKYYNMKKYDEAEKFYNLSTGSRKEFMKTVALGNISLIRKDFDKADKFYDYAKKNFYNGKTVHYHAGYTAYMNREHKRSLDYFESFLKEAENTDSLKNEKMNAVYLCALASVFIEDFEKAQNYSAKFKEMFPQNQTTAGQLEIFIFTQKKHHKEEHDHEHGHGHKHSDDEHYHEGCGGL